MSTTQSTIVHTDPGASRPKPVRPELDIAWQAEQLLLWLLAAGDATAIELQGLDSAEVEQLRACHSSELAVLVKLHQAAQSLDRRALAQLLLGRISGLALAAQSPSEMAAVVRAVRGLPDWVWLAAEAAPATGGAPLSGKEDKAPNSPGAGLPELSGLLLTEDRLGGLGTVQLNRHQRRALEASQRRRG